MRSGAFAGTMSSVAALVHQSAATRTTLLPTRIDWLTHAERLTVSRTAGASRFVMSNAPTSGVGDAVEIALVDEGAPREAVERSRAALGERVLREVDDLDAAVDVTAAVIPLVLVVFVRAVGHEDRAEIGVDL